MTIPRFTDDQILEMRTLYRDGKLQKTIASDYGIKQYMVSLIIRGVCYKNAPWPSTSSGQPRKIMPDFPGYEFDSDGNAYSFHTNKRYGRKMRLWPDTDKGYLMVPIHDVRGKQFLLRVNRIICKLFNGYPPTPSHQAMHLNGIKTDNRAVNLAWGTQVENEKAKVEHGTRPLGEKMNGSVLNDAKIIEIRKSDKSSRELAKQYGVSQQTIHKVVIRETWKHVK